MSLLAQFGCTTNANNTIVISNFTGASGTIVIPNFIGGLPVADIGTNAFYSCSSLTNITIPGTVTKIGSHAFEDCTNLTGVYFLGNAPAADSTVFANDPVVTVYYLPGTAGWDTSYANNTTAPWVLPYPLILNTGPNFGVQTNRFGFTISWATNVPVVVQACSNLANPVWQAVQTNTPSNGWSYFTDSLWTNYRSRFYQLGSLPPPVANPNSFVFSTNNGTLTITEYTGSGGSVNIPATTNGLAVIGIAAGAFENNSDLTSVTIPGSVTNIGQPAFANCDSLTAISVNTNNPVYSSVKGVLFDKELTTLIECPSGIVGIYTVPDGVTNIGNTAFLGCISLTGVGIPDSVTSIGESAFEDCTSLANAKIPDGVTTIGLGTFFNCNKLTNINLGNVTSIGNYAFQSCTNLTSIEIPASVSSLGTGAFSTCLSLTSVFFQGNAPAVGLNVFTGNSNLELYYLGGTTGWGSTFAGHTPLLWDSVDQLGCIINNGMITISDYLGSGGSLVIPGTVDSLPVTAIGAGVFENNSNLTSVTIPAGITNIGLAAFAGCSLLTAINVATNNLAYASVNGVLFDNSQDTLIQYPAGIYGTYLIPSTVTNIGTLAFSACTGLENVFMTESITNIGQAAFWGCSDLNSLNIPASISYMQNYAFENCHNLISMYFQGNAPATAFSVFAGDNNTQLYYTPGTAGWSSSFDGRPATPGIVQY